MCGFGGSGAGTAGDVSSSISPFGPATGRFGVTPDVAAVASEAELGDIGTAETQDQTTAGLFEQGTRRVTDVLGPATAIVPGAVLATTFSGIINVATNTNVNTNLDPDNPNLGRFGATTGSEIDVLDELAEFIAPEIPDIAPPPPAPDTVPTLSTVDPSGDISPPGGFGDAPVRRPIVTPEPEPAQDDINLGGSQTLIGDPRFGRMSTLLTGGLGVLGAAPVRRRTLLGA